MQTRLGILADVVERSSPAYRYFLDRLAEARRSAELTQAAAAKKLVKPQSYISKCETGERRVDVVELAEFADLYGRPIEWFVRVRRKG